MRLDHLRIAPGEGLDGGGLAAHEHGVAVDRQQLGRRVRLVHAHQASEGQARVAAGDVQVHGSKDGRLGTCDVHAAGHDSTAYHLGHERVDPEPVDVTGRASGSAPARRHQSTEVLP